MSDEGITLYQNEDGVFEEYSPYRTVAFMTEEDYKIFENAIEKQSPKKPITYIDTNRADCPICGNTVRGISKPFGNWCSKCGQKLDWGKE